MRDYYLCFDNKDQAYSALSKYVVDNSLCGDTLTCIDEIGVMYDVMVDVLDKVPVLVSRTEKPGYHVNIRSSETLELDDYIVYPLTPSRRWA